MGRRLFVRISDLSAGYDGEIVIEDVSFEITKPEVFVIMGPNGAGKSTLLRAILGLARIHSGTIEVFGYHVPRDISNIRRIIGYMPQREYVSLNMPVRVIDIVASGIALRKGPLSPITRDDLDIVEEVLRRVGIPRDLWKKRFDRLSGGQQQKTLIARALVGKPRLLLLDEPFSAVDIKSLRDIMELIVELKETEGIPTMLVVHDVNEIIEYVDKLALLNRKIIAWGDPASVLTPENLKMTYGVDIKVVPYLGKCLALIGDRHA